MKEEEKVSIRLDLKGQLAERFLAIERELGFRNHTEVVRYLINEVYKQLCERTRTRFSEEPSRE